MIEESRDLSRECCEITSLALPNDDSAPTKLSKLAVDSSVADHVLTKLFLPKLNPRLRRVSELASPVPVPEAAVDEDHGFVLRQHDVGLAGQVAAVKAEAVAHAVQQGADGELRGSV